jgi:hypothetical protein
MRRRQVGLLWDLLEMTTMLARLLMLTVRIWPVVPVALPYWVTNATWSFSISTCASKYLAVRPVDNELLNCKLLWDTVAP